LDGKHAHNDRASLASLGIKNITKNALGHSRFEDFNLNLFD
jgi:hypothetical protein